MPAGAIPVRTEVRCSENDPPGRHPVNLYFTLEIPILSMNDFTPLSASVIGTYALVVLRFEGRGSLVDSATLEGTSGHSGIVRTN